MIRKMASNDDTIQVQIHYDEEVTAPVTKTLQPPPDIDFDLDDTTPPTCDTASSTSSSRSSNLRVSERKLKRIHSMHSTPSIFQRYRMFSERHDFELRTAYAVLLFLFNVYKIVVGSFLTIFTYQKCDILTDKLNCFDQPYEIFALTFNAITFVVCFVLLGYQIHREAYFIRELFPYDKQIQSIETFIEDDNNTLGKLDTSGNDILQMVDAFNTHFAHAVKLSVVVFILNVIFSAFSLFWYMYLGTKTITSFLSNMFLLGLMIVQSLQVVHTTENEQDVIACSAYLQKWIHYTGINVITRLRVEKGMIDDCQLKCCCDPSCLPRRSTSPHLAPSPAPPAPPAPTQHPSSSTSQI